MRTFAKVGASVLAVGAFGAGGAAVGVVGSRAVGWPDVRITIVSGSGAGSARHAARELRGALGNRTGQQRPRAVHGLIPAAGSSALRLRAERSAVIAHPRAAVARNQAQAPGAQHGAGSGKGAGSAKRESRKWYGQDEGFKRGGSSAEDEEAAADRGSSQDHGGGDDATRAAGGSAPPASDRAPAAGAPARPASNGAPAAGAPARPAADSSPPGEEESHRDPQNTPDSSGWWPQDAGYDGASASDDDGDDDGEDDDGE